MFNLIITRLIGWRLWLALLTVGTLEKSENFDPIVAANSMTRNSLAMRIKSARYRIAKRSHAGYIL